MKKILLWIISIFFLLSSLAFIPNSTSIFQFLVCIFLVPASQWQSFLQEKLLLSGKRKGLLVTVLFIAALAFLPATETPIQTDSSLVQSTIKNPIEQFPEETDIFDTPVISEMPESPAGSDPQPDSQASQTVSFPQDFDPDTNQIIQFGVIEFQLPETWSVVEETNGVLYITGREESQLGTMFLELLANETTEEDLKGEECQQGIITAYADLLLNIFYDLECTNAVYYPDDEQFFIFFEGTINDLHSTYEVYAFVEEENLYTYCVPFMDGDSYDYILDLQEVLKSVVPASIQIVEPEFAVLP